MFCVNVLLVISSYVFLIVTDSSCKGKAACDLTRWNDIQFHGLMWQQEELEEVSGCGREVNLMALGWRIYYKGTVDHSVIDRKLGINI